MDDQLKLELCILLLVLLTTRLFYLIHKITNGFTKEASTKRNSPCRTLICIGSGGHTTEMLKLVENLNFENYSPRFYVMAKSDKTSRAKVEALEKNKSKGSYEIVTIPRSRVVHQSYVTSVFTTIYSTLCSIPIVCRILPDLILCNGPGTCIPVCVVSIMLKALFIVDTRIVFVESFCRTQTFSLTGKILRFFADNFLVQWPSLKSKMKRAEYIGQLM